VKARSGFILYDFANSTYHLMVPTIVFPLYFRELVLRGTAQPDSWWAILIAIPVLLAGLLAPFIGAHADQTSSRRGWLTASTLLCVCSLLLIGLLPPHVWLTSLLFIISYASFAVALGLYDAFLPATADRDRASLSGLAWGLGYVGGIVALVITFPWLRDSHLPSDAGSFRTVMLIVGCLYGAIGLLALKWLREPPRASRDGAARSVVQRIRHWRENRGAFGVMASYYLANDGLATLVYFTAIYATATLHFSSSQVLVLFLIVQVVGIPATVIVGRFADRLGHRRVIATTLVLWMALTVGYATLDGILAFYALSIGTGLVIGSTPAVYRALLADRIKETDAAQMFGFNSLAGRASALLGPIVFGALTAISGSQRLAMLSLLVFFGGAFAVLFVSGRGAPVRT